MLKVTRHPNGLVNSYMKNNIVTKIIMNSNTFPANNSHLQVSPPYLTYLTGSYPPDGKDGILISF